jgi:hypothetical protein
MSNADQLLRLAIEDNIAWCSAVCTAHGSNEIASSGTWANLSTSPPFYPNIITRQAGVQGEVEKLTNGVEILNRSKGWGIKDSFCDLALSDKGFERVLSGNWYGGTVTVSDVPTDWRVIGSSERLCSWEKAWGGGKERIFPDELLSDQRISFWFKGEADIVEAGFISFDSGSSVGISNWFSQDKHSLAQMGALQAANSVSHKQPIVCWSSDEILQETGLSRLGPVQVWIKTA